MIVLENSNNNRKLEDYKLKELRYIVIKNNTRCGNGYKYNINPSKATKAELIAFIKNLRLV
jgi:hypothetical protein